MSNETMHGNVRLNDGLGQLPQYSKKFAPRWPNDEPGYTADQMRSYAAEQVAAERDRWIAKCSEAYTEAHAMFDDYRDPANKHVRECIEWQLWRLRHDEIDEMHDLA